MIFFSVEGTQERSLSHFNVYFKNSVSSWWLIVRQSNLECFDYKPWKTLQRNFVGEKTLEHDCTKYGVTPNKTMMSSCKLVVLFERGIPLKHNVLMRYSKIINISLKVMINDWLILGNIIVYQRLFLSSRSFQRINQKLLFKFWFVCVEVRGFFLVILVCLL